MSAAFSFTASIPAGLCLFGGHLLFPRSNSFPGCLCGPAHLFALARVVSVQSFCASLCRSCPFGVSLPFLQCLLLCPVSGFQFEVWSLCNWFLLSRCNFLLPGPASRCCFLSGPVHQVKFKMFLILSHHVSLWHCSSIRWVLHILVLLPCFRFVLSWFQLLNALEFACCQSFVGSCLCFAWGLASCCALWRFCRCLHQWFAAGYLEDFPACLGVLLAL